MTLTAERSRTKTVRRQWRGPRYPGEYPTLGYLVLDWITTHLPSPTDSDKPFVVTDEQGMMILRWYAIDPDVGDFVYRRGRAEMAKGWGKSPILAAIALVEFAGPAQFGGWDEDGEPIGIPWNKPVVEIAAVSEDQTDNTYAVLYEMCTANENRVALRLGIDVGRTRLFLKDRPGSLRPVTASSSSREGARLTFGVLDETHLWTKTNGGVKLAGTLRRNAAKMGGRTFETTNAPVIGEKSVAESSGSDAEPGVLHIVRRPKEEPSPDWTDGQLRETLVYVYGDAYWANPDRLIKEIRDGATPWDDALRFWFNVRTRGVGRAVDPRVWDALAATVEVPLGSYIGLGFDGSEYHDATVLRGCTTDGHTFIIGSWARPAGALEWHVPRAEVNQAVAEAFGRYKVGRMFCDPPRWRDEIDKWAELYGEDVVLALDTNQPTRMAPAVDRWLTAIRAAGAMVRDAIIGPVLLPYSHDDDPFTNDQVKACRLRKVSLADAEDDRTRYMLEKDGRIGNDAAVADVLAYEAAMTMPPPVAAMKPFVLAGRS